MKSLSCITNLQFHQKVLSDASQFFSSITREIDWFIIKGLGGFRNFKKSIFFAYLIIQYV